MADTATAVDFSGDTNDFAGIQEDDDNRGNLIAAPSSSPASTGKDKDSSNSGKAQRPKSAVGSNGNPNNGGSNQGRRKPNPRYLMLEMPADKKTNSRAGIKRAMKLSSRLSQEMFYRTYAKVSDANYFMERIYPGMVLTRKGSEKALEVVTNGFEELTNFWKKLYEEAEAGITAQTSAVVERLESEGVDASGLEMDFSESLEEVALVTSRTDQRYLSLLTLSDRAVGMLSAAGLYEIYTAEELTRLEREVRQHIVNVYRNVVRTSFESFLLLRTGKTSEMRRTERDAKAASAAGSSAAGSSAASDAEKAATESSETVSSSESQEG